MLYGFESYASFPIVLADGSFYGTLCAIDPEPRALNAHETIAALHGLRREGRRSSAESWSASAARRSARPPLAPPEF